MAVTWRRGERPAGEWEVRPPHTPQLQATSIVGPEVAAWTLGTHQNLHNRRMQAYQRSPPLPLGWHLILNLFVDPRWSSDSSAIEAQQVFDDIPTGCYWFSLYLFEKAELPPVAQKKKNPTGKEMLLCGNIS